MSSNRLKFFKSGAMLTVVALAVRSVAMIFGAYVSRTVGAEGVGLYTVVMTVYSFAVTFATSGISLTVTRLVAAAVGEGRCERIGKVVRAAMLYSFIFGISASLLLFFGANIIGKFILGDMRTVLSLKVLAFSLVPISFGAVISGYFVGVRRVTFNAATQVVGQMLKIFVTVILVTRFSEGGIASGVAALCLGITLTELAGFLFQLLEFAYDRYKYEKERAASERNEFSEVTRTAIPLALSAYVRSAFLTLEHVLIPRRLRDGGDSSSEAYSRYGVLHGMALPIILFPMSPLSSFAGLLVPEFAADTSAGQRSRMDRIASEAMNTTLLYSVVCCVLLYFFSEELGYVVYGSHDAGYYIATLAPVVPIMYLDHVTDSMLKGVGEQVYSMWVNITDSILSVILVWVLIPPLGILGYALVIVIMEGYNFALSLLRLRGRVSFRMDYISSLVIPALAGSIASFVTDSIFRFGGSTVSVLWLTLKILFATALTVGIIALANLVRQICTGRTKQGSVT